jgi:hypothetical protein
MCLNLIIVFNNVNPHGVYMFKSLILYAECGKYEKDITIHARSACII